MPPDCVESCAPPAVNPADHLRLVYAYVRGLKLPRGFDRDELIGEGVLALVEAAAVFDAGRGFAFSTLATLYVRRRVIGALRKMVRAATVRSLDVDVESRGQDEGKAADVSLAEAFLASLDEPDRRLLWGRFVDGERFDVLGRAQSLTAAEASSRLDSIAAALRGEGKIQRRFAW